MTLALLGATAGYASAAGTTQWNVDPIHSSAEFTAIHFGLSHIIGTNPDQNGDRRDPSRFARPRLD
jgi:polyisoprenoid-binding protein YceI